MQGARPNSRLPMPKMGAEDSTRRHRLSLLNEATAQGRRSVLWNSMDFVRCMRGMQLIPTG